MLFEIKSSYRWLKVWHTLPVMAWIKAAKFYKAGRFAEAIDYYLKGLKQHPQHPAANCAMMDLAYCLFKNEKFQDAEKYLIKALKYMPDSREAYIRLAKLQIWTGNYYEAAWTLKRAIEAINPDPELLALFIINVLDGGGSSYLMEDFDLMLDRLPSESLSDPLIEVARAKLAIYHGEYDSGKATLAGIASQLIAPVEAQIAYAEILLNEAKVEHARKHLQRGLHFSPSNPRLLGLMAKSYLIESNTQNPAYAKQLAISATQSSGWLSPDAMQVLAQSYYKVGDKITALLVASKAKQVGVQRSGTEKNFEGLDNLIKVLSEGTLA